VLRACIKFFGRQQGGLIRDGVLLGLLPRRFKGVAPRTDRDGCRHNAKKYRFGTVLRVDDPLANRGELL
jgi:hypothetical protein